VKTKTLWTRFITAVAIRTVSWLLWGLCLTLRPVYVPQNVFREALADGYPFIFVTWHGRLLYLFHFYRWTRSRDCTFLVSRSRDGELISRIAQCFSVEPTRGSSSRGGARGLLEIVSKVQRGYIAGVTPDGPRGPRYRVQPGVITIAQKTGAPILPLTYSARWKVVLNSWDQCVIPLPFSRVVVVFGTPMHVSERLSPNGLEAKRQEVEASLRCITTVADAYFYAKGTGRDT
jgi:lysophospholipid acyltransferase (LPLAT)-like uncharacterized protein